MKSLLVMTAAALSSVGTALAAITYVEGPDISTNAFAPSDLGTLGVGLNSISGTLSGSCVERSDVTTSICGPDNQDFFSNVVAPGLVLTAATLTIENLEFDGNLDLLGRVRAFTPVGYKSFDFVEDGTTLDGTFSLLPVDFAFDLYLGIEVLAASLSRPGVPGVVQGIGNYSLNYRLDLTFRDESDPIPVPGALALFATATAAGGALRLRKRARSDAAC